MNEYEKQAVDFLDKTGASFECEFVKFGKHFDGDTENRDVYKITLKRGSRQFSFDFGQSLNDSGLKFKNKNTGRIYCTVPTEEYVKSLTNGKFTLKSKMLLRRHLPFPPASCDTFKVPVAPSAYSVLACLTKYEVGTFEDFCSDFGYSTDSKRAEKTYKAALNEYQNVCVLWNENEIEQLAEIN